MANGPGPSGSGGMHLVIDRRGLLRATTILCSAGLLGAGGVPVWAADVFEELKPQWTAAKIDWTQQKGKTIVLGAEQHPWTSAIQPLLPHFTRLTGIEVELQPQSETDYTAQLPVELGASSPTPDVYMVWAIGQAIQAGWLEPLDAMMADRNLADKIWWDADDIFSSARAIQKWSDGTQYVMAITAESETLFMNRAMLDGRGLGVPATMDDLLETAKALKTDRVAGIALRAKPSGDSMWPVGGFIFSYGGAIIGLDGRVLLDEPEAVAAIDMYGRLLREAGPVGIGSYQWTECLSGFMSGSLAIGCDSTNFATDIADPERSKVAGQALYSMMPRAGDKPVKPNLWHWTAGINARSRNKEAAFLFLQWAGSKPTCMAGRGEWAGDAAGLGLGIERLRGPVRRGSGNRRAGQPRSRRRRPAQGDLVPPESSADPRRPGDRREPERDRRQGRRHRARRGRAGHQASARLTVLRGMSGPMAQVRDDRPLSRPQGLDGSGGVSTIRSRVASSTAARE